MAQFATWFKKAVTTFVDPDRESRVELLVNTIHRAIKGQGQNFYVQTRLTGIEYTPADLREAKGRVYSGALERGWKDGTRTAGEQKTAQWLATRLELGGEARDLNLEFARRNFGSALAQAMQDGILQPDELTRLQEISAAVNCTLPDFARAFFRREGEAFLQSIFLACVADNNISQSDWNYLLHITQQLGLRHEEMLAVVQPQASQFVEHVLADAKSDGQISAQEQKTLQWLLENLRLPSFTRDYVNQEVSRLKALNDIEDGRLPSIGAPPGIEFRSGEIFHWVGPAVWREHRVRKQGVQTLDYEGILVLSDNRLIFAAPLKSQSIGYRKIVAHRGGESWLEVQVEGKPVNQFNIREPSAIPYAVFRTAVAMSNQTKLAKLEEGPSRRIPREVRQRVWQRYGGRCADCSATTYLEFDHIIPVARGGNNSDMNVQLLCRMCNLKKSDHI